MLLWITCAYVSDNKKPPKGGFLLTIRSAKAELGSQEVI